MVGASALEEDSTEKESSRSGTTLHTNNILCGRGGSINTHPGNKNYHRLVESKKLIYLTAWFKQENCLIADSIIPKIRVIDPPGWFLSCNMKTGLWHDIGNKKARDKASQALMENKPLICREMESKNDQKRVKQMRRKMEEPGVNDNCATYFADCFNAEGCNVCSGYLPDSRCDGGCKFTGSVGALCPPDSSFTVPLLKIINTWPSLLVVCVQF